jgi:hypothetical protein
MTDHPTTPATVEDTLAAARVAMLTALEDHTSSLGAVDLEGLVPVMDALGIPTGKMGEDVRAAAEAPAEPEARLSLNGDEGINARLCRALGVDPNRHVGYRLTVMGGEFPAMEVFQLPPMTGDGMFSDSGPVALEDLVADGARIVPPHLALSEFALAKLLDAHATLQNLCASPVSTDGEEIAELRRQQFWAFSALEAALSGWGEAGAPDPKVVAVVTAVVDEHGVSFTAETPDDIGIEEGTEVECYLVPVVEPHDVEPGDQPVPPADPA